MVAWESNESNGMLSGMMENRRPGKFMFLAGKMVYIYIYMRRFPEMLALNHQHSLWRFTQFRIA